MSAVVKEVDLVAVAVIVVTVTAVDNKAAIQLDVT